MVAPRTWPRPGLCRVRCTAARPKLWALMMIDRVVFFITLNPISACCNLSNDSSLLAIAEFKGFFILPHPVDPLGWH